MAESSDTGRSLSGKEFSLDEASCLLADTISRAQDLASEVTEAFRSPWTLHPSGAVRVVLAFWVAKAFRHLRAIITLAKHHDLVKVADVHQRQMLEIFLQARAVISADPTARERMAQKAAAWGCVDYLEKMEKVKEAPFARNGYLEVQDQLTHFDPDIVTEIRSDRKKRNMFWFGMPFTQLGATLSRDGEDLGQVYRIASGQSHGSWDIALDVANPEPGHLDFRGYPNDAQLALWAAETVDEAMVLYHKLWNEVAEAVGAPLIQLPAELGPSPFAPPV